MKSGIYFILFCKTHYERCVIKRRIFIKQKIVFDVLYYNRKTINILVMVQQFYYREFPSMQKRVERFLRKTSRLRVIHREENIHLSRVKYSLELRWPLLGLFMNTKSINLTVEKIDESITRLELSTLPKWNQISKLFPSATSNKYLNNLTFLF